MGLDCTLVLKAKLKKDAAVQLARFCRDWAFVVYLSEKEKAALQSPLRETYEHCASVFDTVCDEASIEQIERGKLDVQYEGKFDNTAVGILIEKFLPFALESLDEFSYDIPELDARAEYSFDPKTRTLSKTESQSDPGEGATEAWLEEYEPLSPDEWVSHLTSFLTLVADPVLQRKVFVEKSEEYDFDSPYTDFEIWFDMNAYYMGRLNLESGLKWAEEEGFLTEARSRALAPFDRVFRNYLPDNMASADAAPLLREPAWQEICVLAKAVLASGAFQSA